MEVGPSSEVERVEGQTFPDLAAQFLVADDERQLLEEAAVACAWVVFRVRDMFVRAHHLRMGEVAVREDVCEVVVDPRIVFCP